MSKIDELIQEFCPEGVEYMQLGAIEDAGLIKLGRGSVISKKDIAAEPGDYPIYSSSASGIGEFGRYGKYMFDDERLSWSVDGGGRFFYRHAHKYSVTNVSGWLKVLDSNRIDIKYLFYALDSAWSTKKFDYTKKAHPSVIRNEYRIPVPPFEVQEEIVNILDKFTQLEAELLAELDARRKQYEYYKQTCFNNIASSRIEHITDIALVKARVGWQRLSKSEHLSTGDYQLITGTDFTLGGDINFSSCVFVTKDRYDMDTNIQVHMDDILITKDGTLGKVAIVRDEPTKPTTLNSGVFRISLNTDDILPSYIYHFFTSKYFSDFVKSVKTGSTIPHLTQQGLTTLNIPIPSLDEQTRIVTILDSFNKLINDISEGLPAEINARRQQYEYYRTQLLTFQELPA